MTDKIDSKPNIEVLRVLHQHCRNEEEYFYFSCTFSYTRQLANLKKYPRADTPQRRHHINKAIDDYLNKLNQMEKTNDQL